MTFYVEGRTNHELMPIEKFFQIHMAEKAHEIDSSHPHTEDEIKFLIEKSAKREKNTYQKIEGFKPATKVVFSEQVMS